MHDAGAGGPEGLWEGRDPWSGLAFRAVDVRIFLMAQHVPQASIRGLGAGEKCRVSDRISRTKARDPPWASLNLSFPVCQVKNTVGLSPITGVMRKCKRRCLQPQAEGSFVSELGLALKQLC